MHLSIVIISFNTKDFLRDCLQSIYRTVQGFSYEIIVVDNGSQDGSVDMLAKEFPEVIVVDNKLNLGFAKANNQAIKRAQGKWILLLNSDAVVKNGAIERLARFMEEQPRIAAVGPKVLNADGTLQSKGLSFPSMKAALMSLFRIPHFFPLRLRKRLFPDLFERNENKIHRVDWVTGCCMMMDKAVIDKIGLLDEDFFFYCEEMEWCFRARKSGYDVYYCPNAEIVHYGGASKIDQPDQRLLKAKALFYKKSFGKLKGIALLLLLILSSLSTWLRFRLIKTRKEEINALHQTIQENVALTKLLINL